MKRRQMNGFNLIDQGGPHMEIEIGWTVVGRVVWRPEDTHTGEDDITVTNYATDIDEGGNYGGTDFTSQSDAFAYIRKTWAADIAAVEAHQRGEHRTGQRDPEGCLVCRVILQEAREWQASDSTYRDLDWDDEVVVSRYHYHAEKMSED